MLKKRGGVCKKEVSNIKILSLFQIFLMISFAFSFSFIFNSSFVVGAEDDALPLPALPLPIDFISEAAANTLTSQTYSPAPTPTEVAAAADAAASGSDSGASGAVSDSKLSDIAPGSGGEGAGAEGAGSSLPPPPEPAGDLTPEQIAERKAAAQEVIDDRREKGALRDETTTEAPFLGLSPFVGTLVEGALYAAAVVGAIQLFGPMFGLEEETTNALSTAAGIGIITTFGLKAVAETGTFKESLGFLVNPELGPLGFSYASWIGIGVAVAVFILMYSKENEKTVTFSCLPWQAPVGGSACEECNKQGILPCSEYQCKSLGQACELINQGTTEENCVWVNSKDVNPPTIEPLENALLNDYEYSPDNTINPPDRGVKINYLESDDNCIPAFTPLRFGVELNEPAACKVDILRKEGFEEMSSFMSSGLLRYNHTHALSLPSPNALASENITIRNNGNHELFVRCQDANGNSNTATFVFKYCVDPEEDTTPPLIVTTSILNEAPIAFNQSSVDLDVFVNEPSECKWSHNNRDFETMEETMSCATGVFDFNAQMLYKCSTTLTGLKDRTDNKVFFRCRDQPNSPENKRNTNAESFEFTLVGTQPLVIDSVEPDNETIKDSTDAVKVSLQAETSSGFKSGEAICYYSDTGESNDFIKFFETGSFEHSQDLFLTEGNYEYFIRCTDLGGNSDLKTINFEVETDLSSPTIVRAYKEENFLKLITDEPSQCRYSTFGCNYEFDEGTQFTDINENNHFTDWDVQTDLYVKCEDDFGNRPLPNQCSIVVRASNF